MKDLDILTGIKKDFTIEEFVDKKTFERHGENAWQFIDLRLLEVVLFIREGIGEPMTINTWHKGGRFSQRGLRTNISQIVYKKAVNGKLYLSAHVMGKAVDFDVKGMDAAEVRGWLLRNKNKVPHKIRLENLMNGKPIGWCHLDVFYNPSNNKVHLFNV